MKYRHFLIVCLLATATLQLQAQGIRNIRISEEANGKSLAVFLQEIEKAHELDIIFDDADIAPLVVSGITEGMYLNTYLELLLRQHDLELKRARTNVFFILNKARQIQFEQKNQSFLILSKQQSKEQLLRGVLKDAETAEPVIGARVVILKTGAGVLTDANGGFQLTIPTGVQELEISYVGYETASYVIGFSPLVETSQLNINLRAAEKELEGVTITAEREDNNIQSLVPGVQRMGIDAIKKLPTFLGEVDPVKSMTTLPGVSTVGELSSGFNVRGGETGQNLILQDGAIIYNPTHLFGFFSAFNPDIVNDVALYKGGGPAGFGGRVSSVLDVKLRNGEVGRHTVKGGVGLVSSRLGLEGPIIKNKASYIIGGRASYSNWLLKATDNIQLQNSSANFYDVTAKTFFRLNQNNYLSFTAYKSHDSFSFASDTTFSWGTTNGSLRWDHTFRDNLFSGLTLAFSNYHSSVANNSEIDAYTYQNAIKNLRLHYDVVNKSRERVQYNFGLEVNGTLLEPGQLKPALEGGNVLPADMDDQTVLETALYWQGDFNLSRKWAVSAGLRYSHFFRIGEDQIYVFDYNNIRGRYPAITDSIQYGRGELISDYGGFEPRLSVRYLLNGSTSIKTSYYRTYQYLHLISNTTSATPQDYWVASGPYLEPAISDQLSLGIFRNLHENSYELSVEGFYRKMTNAVDYIDGADITLNKALEAGLVSGDGRAYGVEVLARKNSGRFGGWVAYTYSRSLRKFTAGEGGLQSINGGRYYPTQFDQPHNLSLILNYKLGARATLSGNFSYSTGRPITIPVSKFSYDVYLSVLNYSERNEYRIPDYHRLDLSLTIEGKARKNTRFRGDWVFSVYNVYSRENVYSIYFTKWGNARKLSILGSAFPSVNYNFRF